MSFKKAKTCVLTSAQWWGKKEKNERKIPTKWLHTDPFPSQQGCGKRLETVPWAHWMVCVPAESCQGFYVQKLLMPANWCYSPIRVIKGKQMFLCKVTQTHCERLQTFSHFNYHNLMPRIHAQMRFMAEDLHIPWNANLVPKLFCMYCSFSEMKSLHWIWVQNVLNTFVPIVSRIAKVCYPVIFIVDFLCVFAF